MECNSTLLPLFDRSLKSLYLIWTTDLKKQSKRYNLNRMKQGTAKFTPLVKTHNGKNFYIQYAYQLVLNYGAHYLSSDMQSVSRI